MDTIKNAAASAAAAASSTAQAAYQNAPSAETLKNVANQATSRVQSAAANITQGTNTGVHVQVPNSNYPPAISFREIVGAPVTKASTDDSILIIIDAQNEYAEGKLTVRNITYTRAAIAALLEKYRLKNAPIIHVLHDTPEGAPVFTPGTRLAEEFEELRPKLPTKGPQDIIQSTTSADPLDAPAQEFRGVKESKEVTVHKQFPGAFTGTNLEELIRGFGRTKVVITGYMAHVCVSTTTRQAAERGLEVVVCGDAVSDRDIPVGSGVDGQGRKVQASGIGGASGPVKAVISGEELTATVLAELEDGFATVLPSSAIF